MNRPGQSRRGAAGDSMGKARQETACNAAADGGDDAALLPHHPAAFTAFGAFDLQQQLAPECTRATWRTGKRTPHHGPTLPNFLFSGLNDLFDAAMRPCVTWPAEVIHCGVQVRDEAVVRASIPAGKPFPFHSLVAGTGHGFQFSPADGAMRGGVICGNCRVNVNIGVEVDGVGSIARNTRNPEQFRPDH